MFGPECFRRGQSGWRLSPGDTPEVVLCQSHPTWKVMEGNPAEELEKLDMSITVLGARCLLSFSSTAFSQMMDRQASIITNRAEWFAWHLHFLKSIRTYVTNTRTHTCM